MARRTAGVAAGSLVLLLAGCGGGDAPTAAATPVPTAAAAVAAAPTCAPPEPGGASWPEEVPADLPKPPGATITEVQDRPDGLTVVMFTTSTSIRESVLFLVEALPAAGYVLARGDAENTEADVPFVKGDLRGVMRMIAVQPCRTDWLLALSTRSATAAPGGGSPLLPPRADASPLPFG